MLTYVLKIHIWFFINVVYLNKIQQKLIKKTARKQVKLKFRYGLFCIDTLVQVLLLQWLLLTFRSQVKWLPCCLMNTGGEFNKLNELKVLDEVVILMLLLHFTQSENVLNASRKWKLFSEWRLCWQSDQASGQPLDTRPGI